MSGFAYNNQNSQPEQEAAGKAGMYLGAIASIVMPFAAPAIFGSITASGVLGTGLRLAATNTGFLGSLTRVLGSAAVNALSQAGVAAASGADNRDVWRAAGMGALQGGVGGLTRGAPVPAGGTVSGTVNSTGGLVAQQAAQPTVGSIFTGGGYGFTAAPAAQGAAQGGGFFDQIGRLVGGDGAGSDMTRRIGAAIVNAAVNKTSLNQLDGVVAEQRRQLQALYNTDRPAYNQRISTAQQILSEADKMDPEWYARTRMADVAGMEATQFQQAMRNIAVRQGGSLDSGQRKAYERGAALHTARSKALAYNQGHVQATGAQNQLRATGMAGLTPDDAAFRNLGAQGDLALGAWDARRQLNQNTAGEFTAAFTEPTYRPPASRDPSENDEDTLGWGFGGAFTNTFGGSN